MARFGQWLRLELLQDQRVALHGSTCRVSQHPLCQDMVPSVPSSLLQYWAIALGPPREMSSPTPPGWPCPLLMQIPGLAP